VLQVSDPRTQILSTRNSKDLFWQWKRLPFVRTIRVIRRFERWIIQKQSTIRMFLRKVFRRQIGIWTVQNPFSIRCHETLTRGCRTNFWSFDFQFVPNGITTRHIRIVSTQQIVAKLCHEQLRRWRSEIDTWVGLVHCFSNVSADYFIRSRSVNAFQSPHNCSRQ